MSDAWSTTTMERNIRADMEVNRKFDNIVTWIFACLLGCVAYVLWNNKVEITVEWQQFK